MKKRVVTAHVGEAADAAFARLCRIRTEHAIVYDVREVVGVVTALELGGAAGARLRRGRTVDELMWPCTVTATPDMTFTQAARLLRGRSVGCLPVLREDTVVGIVTMSDLLTRLARLR